MENAIIARIAQDLGLPEAQVGSAINLLEKGATAPFISRYRKEATSGIDGIKIQAVQERMTYYQELIQRRNALTRLLADQGKLTDDLRARIENSYTRIEVEDLFYLVKPRKRSRAAEAREKGLEPLAEYLWNQEPDAWSLEEHADVFIISEKKVTSREQALQGALDIIAEWISDNIDTRRSLRETLWREGFVVSTVVPAKAGQKTKYSMYYDRREPVASIPSHRVLAIRRGTKEGILTSAIEGDNNKALELMRDTVIHDKDSVFAPLLELAVRECYNHILRPMIETEVRAMLKERADREAIRVFQENLTNLLLSPPAGPMVVMGLDPGKAGECRLAVIDETGKLLETAAIFTKPPRPPSVPERKAPEAAPVPVVTSEPATEASAEPSTPAAPADIQPSPEPEPVSEPLPAEAAHEGGLPAPEAAPPAMELAQADQAPPAEVPGEPALVPLSEPVQPVQPAAAGEGSTVPVVTEAEPAPASIEALATQEAALSAEPPTSESPQQSEPQPILPAMPAEAAVLTVPAMIAPMDQSVQAEALPESPIPTDSDQSETPGVSVDNSNDGSQAENEPASAGSGADEPVPMPESPALPSAQEYLEAARKTLAGLLAKHRVQALAIGSGPGARELEILLRQILADERIDNVVIASVNDAGVAIYASSRAAREEFPDLNVSTRCAVSLARRLQDPMAELVKIDPKLIGVGQYQHDVDQKELHRALVQTVQFCVNHVGVNLNCGGYSLLRYVAGLNDKLAKKIVSIRSAKGDYPSRESFKQLAGLDAQAYEQAIGFLRIRGGENPLDQTAIHPESYPRVEKMRAASGVGIAELLGNTSLVSSLKLEDFAADGVGLHTLYDIRGELMKPGRDPRKTFAAPKFRADIKSIADLKEGITLEGTVTNVTNFGAFVDIGVQQDGLVHLSQMSNRFIRDPREAVKVGDVVQVKVISVEVETKRIGLSMKALMPSLARRRKKPRRRNSRESTPETAAPSPAAGAIAEPLQAPPEQGARPRPRPSMGRDRPGPPREGDRGHRRRYQGRRPERPREQRETPKEAPPEPKEPERTLQEKIAILQSKFRGIG